MRLFTIRPRIRRGIELLKEEKEKEEVKQEVKIKLRKKAIKKKARRIVTKNLSQ